MFELFMALFGGLFWGGKLANDKIETQNARKTYEKNAISDSQRKNIWLSKVTDKKLEEEIELLIYDTTNYNKIWDEISETYKEMPWRRDKQFVCLTPTDVELHYGRGTYTKKERENIVDYDTTEVKRILMANHGKLLYNDAFYGINQYEYSGYPQATARKLCQDEVNFIIWITNKLRKSGVSERVFIEQNTNYYLASRYPTYRGVYKWESLIPTFLQNNKHF